MNANFHTHTTFCDGKSTPEEVVVKALEKGFVSLGFSGHGHTVFDDTYCMQDTEGYMAEIGRLKEKYKKDIEIYMGIEEDANEWVSRKDFDYMIGSLHYLQVDGTYYSVDSGYDHISRGIAALGGDAMRYAERYYSEFCDYIRKRKPDIVGHFDLLTKYDEKNDSLFSHEEAYLKLAEKYAAQAADNDCLFEVNAGAMTRGYRTEPYPHERILYQFKKKNAGMIISSDSHSAETLDFGFDMMRNILKDIGFGYTYILYHGEFQKVYL